MPFGKSISMLGAVLVLLAPVVGAQQVTAVRANRMVDVRAGTIIGPAVVVIEDGRITAVNPPALPPGAQVIDLGNVTMLPGLIDSHVHLTMDAPDSAGRWLSVPVRETAADAALKGARNARVTLLAGFTTVRNVGATGFADIALTKAIDAGSVPGPRIIPAAHAIGITGGHCDESGGFAPGVLPVGPLEGVADGQDQVLEAVREQIKYGAKVIKICATAGVLSSEGSVGAQQMTAAEMQTAVQEAARHGLKVAAHAHGTAGIKTATQAGVASIEHGSMLDDEAISLMKQHGTYLVPTTYLRDITLAGLPPDIAAKRASITKVAIESHRRAIAAGVTIAFGTDAGVFPHGQNAREFASLVNRGMTPMAAIQAATLNASALLGVTDRGELAAGKVADIIAVPGNPLDDITTLERVTFVMKGGVVYLTPPR